MNGPTWTAVTVLAGSAFAGQRFTPVVHLKSDTWLGPGLELGARCCSETGAFHSSASASMEGATSRLGYSWWYQAGAGISGTFTHEWEGQGIEPGIELQATLFVVGAYAGWTSRRWYLGAQVGWP